MVFHITVNIFLRIIESLSSSSADTNIKTLKTYGYTTSNLSLLNDRIEFTDEEIGNGCSTVLFQSVEHCIQMIQSLGWQER